MTEYGGAVAPAGGAAPTCARHPGTVSYVSCQRCGQPVCPACMRPAAVGVQCVTCVGEGAKAVRQPRTIVGAAVIGRPAVTITVVGVCVAVFAAQLLTRGAAGGGITGQLAFWPAIGAVQPYRFLTAAFLHSTSFWGHIMFNMLAFWQCGQLLERAFGHWRFAALCLATALGGSVGYLLLSGGPGGPGWNVPVVGASGMVFGLFGALIPVLRRTGNSVRQILGLIAINAVLGFVVPGIAWQAHLGGLLVGLGIAYAWAKAPRARQQLVGWLAPLAAVVVLIAAAYMFYEATGWLTIIRQLSL